MGVVGRVKIDQVLEDVDVLAGRAQRRLRCVLRIGRLHEPKRQWRVADGLAFKMHEGALKPGM